MDDLDDLFTDPLSIPSSSPVTPGLLERLEELHSNGCRQKICWSKIGWVFYITADRRSISTAALQYDPTEGTWGQKVLANHTLPNHVEKTYKGRELAHLSWHPGGQELAVTDVFGQISMIAANAPVNRFGVVKTWYTGLDDPLNTIVGMTWLNSKNLFPLYQSATKQGGQWNYAATSYNTQGPFNPAGKPAVAVITRGGYFKLYWQSQDNQWHDAKYEVDHLSTPADIFTHAALCSYEDDTFLLVVYTAERQIRLYRISLDWQQSVGKEVPPHAVFNHLETVEDLGPTTDSIDTQSSAFTAPSAFAQLSHLELVPSGVGTRDMETPLPTILAVFSYVPSQYHDTDLQDSGVFSILSRWEFCATKPDLHPCFDQLPSKRINTPTSNNSKELRTLRRLKDIRTHRIAIQINQLNGGTIIAIAYEDGSIDFLDRATFETRSPDDDDNRVLGLEQVGFAFRGFEPCLHSALSPNMCLKMTLGRDHEPKLGVICMTNDGTRMGEPLSLDKISQAFVLQHTMSGLLNSNNDDLLTAMLDFMHQLALNNSNESLANCASLQRDFLGDLYRTLAVNVDRTFDPQPDKIVRHSKIQRLFSIQAALGFNVKKRGRTVPSKIAWMLENLRIIHLMFAFSFAKRDTHGAESDITKPEIYRLMVGPTSWTMMLMDYIIDQIYELSRRQRAKKSFDADLLRKDVTSLNTPALSLVLISISRTFFKTNSRGVRGVYHYLQNHFLANKIQPSSSILQTTQDLAAAFKSAHTSPSQFEQLLSDAENAVKDAYAKADPPISESQRQNIEKDMLILGIIPDLLMPAVQQLFTVSVARLRKEADEGELYFKDFSMLGLGDDEQTKQWHQENTLDAIRKVVLQTKVRGKAVNVRVCLRCRAVMEDIQSFGNTSSWVMSLLRGHCFCGSYWVVEDHV